ncbi:hypothetical protein [Clostridium estertheticum]|nr:hypothetical protein [Clostridium estertheticum]
MLIQAIQYWKKNKEVAKGHLLAAILALVFSIFEFIKWIGLKKRTLL